MTEPVEGAGNDPVDSGAPQGTHPAWGELYGVVPQEHHAGMTPILKNWEQGVNKRFEKLHSDYEPWKPVISSGADPQTTQFALNLLNALESDPKMVYKAIGDFYKDQLTDLQPPANKPGQGSGEPNSGADDQPWLNEIQTLKQQQEMMARAIVASNQEKQNAAQDAALDNDLNAARKTHGDFDEQYVLGMLMADNSLSVDQAVQTWKQSVQKYAEQLGFTGPKPLFMGGGSAIPNENVDVRKLDNKGTKNLVVQMLQKAALENRQ